MRHRSAKSPQGNEHMNDKQKMVGKGDSGEHGRARGGSPKWTNRTRLPLRPPWGRRRGPQAFHGATTIRARRACRPSRTVESLSTARKWTPAPAARSPLRCGRRHAGTAHPIPPGRQAHPAVDPHAKRVEPASFYGAAARQGRCARASAKAVVNGASTQPECSKSALRQSWRRPPAAG